jgi:hypothetical protein
MQKCGVLRLYARKVPRVRLTDGRTTGYILYIAMHHLYHINTHVFVDNVDSTASDTVRQIRSPIVRSHRTLTHLSNRSAIRSG